MLLLSDQIVYTMGLLQKGVKLLTWNYLSHLGICISTHYSFNSDPNPNNLSSPRKKRYPKNVKYLTNNINIFTLTVNEKCIKNMLEFHSVIKSTEKREEN